MRIDAIYRCRIDYEVSPGPYDARKTRLERVADLVSVVASKLGVYISYWRAGPCHNAYIEIESEDRVKLIEAYTQIRAIILRFKGGKVYE